MHRPQTYPCLLLDEHLQEQIAADDPYSQLPAIHADDGDDDAIGEMKAGVRGEGFPMNRKEKPSLGIIK